MHAYFEDPAWAWGRGRMKSYNAEKRFGFIACPPLHSRFRGDVFVHESRLNGAKIGDIVEFQYSLNAKGMPRADNVTVVSVRVAQVLTLGGNTVPVSLVDGEQVSCLRARVAEQFKTPLVFVSFVRTDGASADIEDGMFVVVGKAGIDDITAVRLDLAHTAKKKIQAHLDSRQAFLRAADCFTTFGGVECAPRIFEKAGKVVARIHKCFYASGLNRYYYSIKTFVYDQATDMVMDMPGPGETESSEAQFEESRSRSLTD